MENRSDFNLLLLFSFRFSAPLLISFRYFKYDSPFTVSFRCNLILIYFFKVISFHLEIFYVIIQRLTGEDPDFLKRGGALYFGHHGWPPKKIVSFRWSKKADITLETISFWENTSISIFKFSPFLSIKSHKFFKIY